MRGTNEKCKIRSKGLGRGHLTYFWNFGIHIISLERAKLEQCFIQPPNTWGKSWKLGGKMASAKCEPIMGV